MVTLRVLVGLLCIAGCSAAWGYSSDNTYYTVDSNAGLVVKFLRRDTGSSVTSIGDISSIRYNGRELQYQSKGSHVNSGFDWLYSGQNSVSITCEYVGSQTIKVTVTAVHLTHYYMIRKGENNIYMGTYFTQEPNIHGHVRYIFRLLQSQLPNGPEPSDIRGNVGALESGDIFRTPNGESRSKHYSNMRLKDWTYIGATGNGVGAWVVRGNQEGGSGGPFYRSLLNQCTSTSQELTYIVNYGQAQTEAFRMGILNDYTLVITDGATPSTNLDKSWFSSMNLLGYTQSRGTITGVGVNNRAPGLEYTVGFASPSGQYWADATNGGYSVSGVRTGTYTMTVYRGELAIHSQSGIGVSAGSTTVLNSITPSGDPSDASYIWRIGTWDGRPTEFLNGDKLTIMHPSDPRMSNWQSGNFIVGEHTPRRFPAYMWQDINNGYTVYFKLNSAQYSQSHKVRIGLTVAYSGGRPTIDVNSWSSGIPSPSTQPKSRSLTTGSYRGNNVIFEYNVPASAFNKNSGYNTLRIWIASGSGLGGYLSAGVSFDCIDMLGDGGAPNPPPPAPPAAFTAGTYTIASKYTGKLLEVADASTANGGNVQQWPSNGHDCQKWRFESVGSGFFKVTNVHSGKVMDVSGASTDDGANVLQWEYTGGQNQQWSVVASGAYYLMVNRNSGKALDLLDWDEEDGANIGQWTSNSLDVQLWTFTAV